jgi:AcrR family transcriptional regulator
VRAPVGEGRERLLEALFDEFGESGPSPTLSMRQVAERLGVHHTLLTYHFGSRPRLLGAVLSEARRRDNLVITAADDELGFVPLLRAIWRFYSDPSRLDRIRAFFHLAGLAVYDHDAFEEFVTDLDDLAEVLHAAALRDGCTDADARQSSLVAIACVRGLLLQLLLTPHVELDAAAERFIRALSAAAPEALDERQPRSPT